MFKLGVAFMTSTEISGHGTHHLILMSQNYGIEDIYRGVISDVIIQVREAFLDEGVDVDVLQQLKKSWEAKMCSSGAVELDGHGGNNSSGSRSTQQQLVVHQQQVPPPALRQPPTTSAATRQHHPPRQPTTANFPAVSAANLSVGSHQLLLSGQQQMTGGHPCHSANAQVRLTPQQQTMAVAVAKQPQQLGTGVNLSSILQQTQQQQIQNAALIGLPAQLLASSVENSQLLQPNALRLMPGAQYAIMDGPGGAQNLILLATAASGQMNALAANIEQQHGQQHAMQFVGQPNVRSVQQRPTTVAMKTEPGGGQLPQLDGGRQWASSNKRNKAKTDGKANSRLELAQLDGGRGKAPPGMTDESSEEEEDREDEEDPTLSAIKYGLDEDHIDGEAEEEEEPLNSGDDQSDDEDLDTLFDADNVVVCQFEKVHRARNKWKFTLKDGMMQIRGKDFCFQKCTGEAEW
uniref:Uncharacterized protein n=1 Tax=Globodera rostochiensis TaxID=31243 RepID=A0A914HTZ1_GLORO